MGKTGERVVAGGGGRGAQERRRQRLREVYGIPGRGAAGPVDMEAVRVAVERAARAARDGWRALANVDHVALADAGGREALEDLEFLVNRGLCELGGVRNILCLARRLA